METNALNSIPRRPLSQRVNLRLVVFFGAVLLVLGLVMWPFLRVLLTGGIIDRGDVVEVDLKAMSNFEMDQLAATDAAIPPRFRALDGKRVALVGEMYVGSAAAGRQTDFNLVYSIARCCFTGTPKIQHFVKAKVLPGRKVELLPGLVRAVGTLHATMEKDPQTGQILSVYRLDVERVDPRT